MHHYIQIAKQEESICIKDPRLADECAPETVGNQIR